MIWLKVITAAVLSGSLFGVVETVLPPRPPQPFTIQVSDWPGDQIFALIEPLGLEDSRVHFDIRRIPPSRDPVVAFRDGLVDAVVVGLDRLPELSPEEVRVIYAIDEVAGGGALVAGPGMVSPAVLHGRHVGMAFGAAAQPLMDALLDRAGLGPRAVTTESMGFEAAVAALQSGRLAAVAALAPSQVAALQNLPGSTLLASTVDQAGLVTHVLVVRERTIPEQRDRLDAVVRTLSQAIEHCRADWNPCLDLIAKTSGRSIQEWRPDFEAVRLLDAKDNLTLFDGGPDAPIAGRLSAALTPMSGRHPGAAPPSIMTVPIASWLDQTILEQAVRQ